MSDSSNNDGFEVRPLTDAQMRNLDVGDFFERDRAMVVSHDGSVTEVSRHLTRREHAVLARPRPTLAEACLQAGHWYTGIAIGHVVLAILYGESLVALAKLLLWLGCLTAVVAVGWRRRVSRWTRDRRAVETAATYRALHAKNGGTR